MMDDSIGADAVILQIRGLRYALWLLVACSAGPAMKWRQPPAKLPISAGEAELAGDGVILNMA